MESQSELLTSMERIHKLLSKLHETPLSSDRAMMLIAAGDIAEQAVERAHASLRRALGQ